MANPRTGSFAAVTTLSQDLVNQLLAGAASTASMPSFSVPSLVTVESDQVGLAGSLTLIAPTVALAANAGNLVAASFSCSGTLQLTSDGTPVVEVEVILSATVQASLTVNVTPNSLAIVLDNSTASFTSLGIAVKFGPPLATVFQGALTSGPVIALFTKAVQDLPARALAVTVPGAQGTFDIAYGGYTVSLEISRVLAVPLNGVLNVALDVAGYTSGDESQLVDLIHTDSPTPLYFAVDRYGSGEDVEGGIFGPHVGVGVEDGYVDSFGTNLAVAVNTDFLCAVVNGPLSSAISNTLISVVPTVFTASYTVGAGDTLETIAQNLYSQMTDYPVGAELQAAQISLQLSGLEIKVSGPKSVLPPAITVFADPPSGSKPGTRATETVSIGGSAPNNTITIGGTTTVGDTIWFNLPAGGVYMTSLSLQVQGVTNSDPAHSSPDLPTLPYNCLTLSVVATM